MILTLGCFEILDIEFQYKKQLSIYVLIISCICLIVLIFVMRANHSVFFDKDGIVIKNGKIKQKFLWREIKKIHFTKKGFLYMVIETINEFDNNNTFFIPLQLLITEWKKNDELAQIESYISKLNYEFNITTINDVAVYKPTNNSSSYTLQRKSITLLMVFFGIFIVIMFCAFPLKTFLIIGGVYIFIFILTLVFRDKNDLVFDTAGMTVYRKRNMYFVPWERIIKIVFEFGSTQDIVIIYKNDNDSVETITWEGVGLFNVNADLYDFYMNVSLLRGKSAVDDFRRIK